MLTPLLIPAFLCGYALGSLPFAVWVARAHGVDILKAGSGNPGATNVKRVVGRKAGNLVFALDCAKGLIAAGLFLWLPGENPAGILSAAGFIGALLGHTYSVWLRFRGGKGVAVTMGGLAAALPAVLLAGVAFWGLVFLLSRIVSLASLTFALSLVLCTLLFPESAFWWGVRPPLALPLSLFVALLILYRHRSNLQRLLSGQELSFKKPSK